jgi:AcrR family transcriptional regulator
MSFDPPSAKSPRRAAAPTHPDGRALHKGQQTKRLIIDAALGLAAQIGLEGLSIGVLAEVTGMSKSGVFAHFGSREELQISVIREYFARFEHEIFYPALEHQRGLARLHALFENWMKRVTIEIQSGCIFISGAVDFDDRPGPVRDALASSVKVWLAAVQRAIVQAKEEGQLNEQADDRQICFEIHALILAVHYESRFLKAPGAIDRANAAFKQIVARYAVPSPAAETSPSRDRSRAAPRSPSKTTRNPKSSSHQE